VIQVVLFFISAMDSSLNTPNIKGTRLLLRAKAVLERHGLNDASCSDAISRLRKATVADIGMHDHLHKILMDKGDRPANQFTMDYSCAEQMSEEEEGDEHRAIGPQTPRGRR
jgi:hypothetical protein